MHIRWPKTTERPIAFPHRPQHLRSFTARTRRQPCPTSQSPRSGTAGRSGSAKAKARQAGPAAGRDGNLWDVHRCAHTHTHTHRTAPAANPALSGIHTRVMPTDTFQRPCRGPPCYWGLPALQACIYIVLQSVSVYSMTMNTFYARYYCFQAQSCYIFHIFSTVHV